MSNIDKFLCIVFAITAVIMAYYHGREAGKEEVIEKTEKYITVMEKCVEEMNKKASGIHEQYRLMIDEAIKSIKDKKKAEKNNI